MSQPKVLATYKSPCGERGHLVKQLAQQHNKGRFILCIRCNMPQETMTWVSLGNGLPMQAQRIVYPEQYLVKEWP